jgi:hypothetical protein
MCMACSCRSYRASSFRSTIRNLARIGFIHLLPNRIVHPARIRRVQGATLCPGKVNAAQLRFSTIRGRIRLDVLVERQHVLGVVFSLHLNQASVVRSVRGPDKLVAGFAQLIDVHSIRKGLQIVAQSLVCPTASRPMRVTAL